MLHGAWLANATSSRITRLTDDIKTHAKKEKESTRTRYVYQGTYEYARRVLQALKLLSKVKLFSSIMDDDDALLVVPASGRPNPLATRKASTTSVYVHRQHHLIAAALCSLPGRSPLPSQTAYIEFNKDFFPPFFDNPCLPQHEEAEELDAVCLQLL